jgi:hypothetical protein
LPPNPLKGAYNNIFEQKSPLGDLGVKIRKYFMPSSIDITALACKAMGCFYD